MAGMKLLLLQARRHGLTKHHSSPFYSLHRYLSSSSPDDALNTTTTANPGPIPNPNPSKSELPRNPIPIEPVSYAVKPTEPTESRSVNQTTRSDWTREDARYVKDAPSISAVSYPTRVAPLPEDRGSDANAKESDEIETERRRIDAESRAKSRVFRAAKEEEKINVPFATLIKPVKKNEKKPVLDLMEAIKEVKANATAKFDETIEAHVRLGIQIGRSDQKIRGEVALPHSVTKNVRVAFFAEGSDAEEARAAGADIVGSIELIEEIAASGKINFDRCLATSQVMPRLFKISKILNSHGMMPSVKRGGIVTGDFTKAINEAKVGRTIFKNDKTSIVHVGLGKVSFPEEALRDNFGAFMNALLLAKPVGLKKTSKYAGYVNAFHICSTMGPGFAVSIQSLSRAADHYKVQVK